MKAKEKVELQELLFCLWTDAHMALDDRWDRTDAGFKAQIQVIEKFASKHDIELKDVTEE